MARHDVHHLQRLPSTYPQYSSKPGQWCLPSASACEGPACKASRLADASTRVCLLFAIKRVSLLLSDVLVLGAVEHPASSLCSAMQNGHQSGQGSTNLSWSKHIIFNFTDRQLDGCIYVTVRHCDACRTERGELTGVRSHKSRLWQTLPSGLTCLHG